MKTILSFFSSFAFAVLLLTGCSKKEDTPAASARTVKYEITGNFTGTIDLVYTDNTGNMTTLTINSLPWSREINYGANVLGIGFGAQGQNGTAGQSATIKIYSAGNVVRSGNGTATALGIISLPTIAYSF